MKKILYLILTTASFSLGIKTAEGNIKPSALITLNKSSENYAQICNTEANLCDSHEGIWQVKNAPDIFYLIKKPLKLIKIEKNNNKLIKSNEWDFSARYADDLNQSLRGGIEGVYIYPALYPLSKQKVAIAIISRKMNSFTGGKREVEYADFLMINSDNSFEVAFKNRPFYSHKMVQTCFSDEDFANAIHCHDEHWCILNLKFIDEGEHFYKWRFIEKTHSFPAKKPDFSTDVQTQESILSPFKFETKKPQKKS